MKCQAIGALLIACSICHADPPAQESKDIAAEVAQIRRLLQARNIQPAPGSPYDLSRVQGKDATQVRRDLAQIRRQLERAPLPKGNAGIGGNSGPSAASAPAKPLSPGVLGRKRKL